MKRLTHLFLAVIALGAIQSASAQDRKEKPNVILIFTDDQGYADLGCYGGKGFKTPNIDTMAKQGALFTSFYTGCPVCSGSRQALLTGRHYQRVGLPAVMFPGNKNGLNPNEITIAEMLRELGYVTIIIGKWHLGHLRPYLPTRHGFDSYFGIPYSNDMTIDPKNAVFAKNVLFREGMTEEMARGKPIRNKVPLMRGDEVIEYPADQSTLTKRYTEEAVKFIKTNKDRPFFIYMPHTMPHVPLAVSKEFKGRTKTLFGDIMEELDWSVGQILKTVKDTGIDKETLVIFTSDNGAHQGSALPLRARKASMYEGGVRVPFIARWPDHIPAGLRSDEVAATVDMLPTIAHIAGGKVPDDRPIDGKDIRALLFEKGAKTPHENYFLAHGGGAVRHGNWKFYPWPEGQQKGKKKNKDKAPIKGPRVQLYDLSKDISEKINVAEQHPQLVAQLQAAFDEFRAGLNKNKLPDPNATNKGNKKKGKNKKKS